MLVCVCLSATSNTYLSVVSSLLSVIRVMIEPEKECQFVCCACVISELSLNPSAQFHIAHPQTPQTTTSKHSVRLWLWLWLCECVSAFSVVGRRKATRRTNQFLLLLFFPLAFVLIPVGTVVTRLNQEQRL